MTSALGDRQKRAEKGGETEKDWHFFFLINLFTSNTYNKQNTFTVHIYLVLFNHADDDKNQSCCFF